MLFQMIVLVVGSCVVGGLHCGNIGAENTGGCAVCVMELGTFLKCFNNNPPPPNPSSPSCAQLVTSMPCLHMLAFPFQ
jgi:hypothetical protein